MLLFLEQDTSLTPAREFVRIKIQMCDIYDVTMVACTLQAVQPHAASLGAIAFYKEVSSL